MSSYTDHRPAEVLASNGQDGMSSQDGPTASPEDMMPPAPVHASSSQSMTHSAYSSGAPGSSSHAGAGVTSSTYPQRPGLPEQRDSSGYSQTSARGITGPGGEDAVPVAFDEGVLRGLCDMDCGLPLLADRIKQSIASCKQVAVFFRSRAELEEKYGRSVAELCRTTVDVYSRADCKAGSFVNAYQQSMRLQHQIAENRIRFSQRLVEMSEELLSLAREGEKLRKLHKENGQRYQSILHESEMAMDKAKARFDATAEELERVLVAKEGESLKESGMVTGPSGQQGAGGNKKTFGKAMKQGGMLFKGKGAASMQRQEDDVRARMTQASETFRKAVLESQALRQEYFNLQLPKILRLLKECADELDMGTQYHLTRFAFLYESTTVTDGTTLNPISAPEEAPGLKTIFELIDNRSDFKAYMQNYAVARGVPRGPRRDGPYDDGYTPSLPSQNPALAGPGSGAQGGNNMNKGPPYTSAPPLISAPSQFSIPSSDLGSGLGFGSGAGPSHVSAPLGASTNTITNGSRGNGSSFSSQGGQGSQAEYEVAGLPATSGATFGVDLTSQIARDSTEVPRVVHKCAECIEAYGLDSMGIYRLSGTTSRVQALKKALDTNIDGTDVMSDQWSADINVVSGALKLWFRELPEPLLTFHLYHQFIEAARYENDRLRHIRLHEQVNELPDANYATLKFFMAHLDRVRRKSSVNQMSVSNLSIVFGPTLLGAPPGEEGLNLEHMQFQCKAIETILEKYNEIFVEDDGETAAAAGEEGAEP